MATRRRELVEAVRVYTALPNRGNWLVLRRHSRTRVRAYLASLPEDSDWLVRTEFWERVLRKIPIRTYGKLTDEPTIAQEELDAYLIAHPEALTGNAEADVCRKHAVWVHDLPRLRETLRVLLDPSVQVTERLDEVLGGDYRLPGFGPATATTILECWNDGVDEVDGPMYAKWTGHTERALDLFGIHFRAGAPGETYAAVWECEREMLRDFHEFIDLSDVDLFMLFVDPRGLDMGRR